MASEGLLLVVGETGPGVSDQEFNAWYNNNHTPAQLTAPGTNTAARYVAHDGEKPSWLAIYDMNTPQDAFNEPSKPLSTDAQQNEAELISKLELLDRRVCKIFHSVTSPEDGTEEALKSASPFLLVVESSVSDELHDEYNQWYKEHLTDVVKSPGCLRGRRYRLISSTELTGKLQTEEHFQHRYVAVYNWDSDTYYFETNQTFNESVTPLTLAILPKIKLRMRRFKLHQDFFKSE
ncbi:hypothetical protein FA15DRAFT_673997 [Coprinopsis marcescibilis]|uniref:ABM domain-containing protein n=1 Tax=Coprinopsis marcescibilis TaxID=230819 RepID=A0A5C3KIC8_COPMA|nr:hypothetical protein FA15DRAFT_673997 [Coprinopsis marcescibilis]